MKWMVYTVYFFFKLQSTNLLFQFINVNNLYTLLETESKKKKEKVALKETAVK